MTLILLFLIFNLLLIYAIAKLWKFANTRRYKKVLSDLQKKGYKITSVDIPLKKKPSELIIKNEISTFFRYNGFEYSYPTYQRVNYEIMNENKYCYIEIKKKPFFKEEYKIYFIN